MSSLKANTLRLPLPVIRLLTIGLLVNAFSVATAQAQYSMPPTQPVASDDTATTGYNDAVLVDVLWNDYAMGSELDVATLTIVSEPLSGTVAVNSTTGMIVYTPDGSSANNDQFLYQISDTAGNVSNVAIVDIYFMNAPPTISLEFPYEDLDDMWVFKGTVDDENPAVCKVTFGGILQGQTATADENGDFVLYLLLENGEEGLYTAETTDEVGEVSNLAEEILIRF